MPSARLAVLVSGSGTILEAMVAHGLPIALVVADRPCRALEVADAAGLETALVDRRAYGGFRADFDRAAYTEVLTKRLVDADVGLIAMAGFGTVLTGALHAAFAGRVLNTHPSLLPAFRGWHSVRDAIAAGATESGCTVHVATEELDDGPILAQERVEVRPDDSESTLHERIKSVERTLYPAVIAQVLAALAEGREPSTLAVA